MKYTVYKTTNKINGKIYIGVHKTNDLDDSYIGSGTLLKRAIEKYGIENFEKEILAVFDKAADMFEMESELVNEDFISKKDTYNIKLGGHGGFDHLNDGSDEHIMRCLQANQKRKEKLDSGCSSFSENFKKTWRERSEDDEKVRLEKMKNTKEESSLFLYNDKKEIYRTFKNKTHTDETKRKIGAANSISQKGEKNSSYGTMWITNGTENKKIKKDADIPDGWYKGRKMKSHLPNNLV